MAIVSRFNPYPAKKTVSPGEHGAKKAYKTTATAPFTISRQRVPGVTRTEGGATTHVPAAGATVWLTELQAEYELAQGHVELLDPQPDEDGEATGKTAE